MNDKELDNLKKNITLAMKGKSVDGTLGYVLEETDFENVAEIIVNLLPIHSVSDMFDFASYVDYKFDYYDNTKLGDIYTNTVTGKKLTQEQIYKEWIKQK